MKYYASQQGWNGKTLVEVNSGTNVNFDRLRHISEGAETDNPVYKTFIKQSLPN